MKTVIIHVPHSSPDFPAGEAGRLAVGGEELKEELRRLTDWYTDELFDLATRGARSLVYPYSRFLVDPERFPVDDREPMAARGMGAVYTRTTDGNALRPGLTPAERERLISAYYRPHHRKLERLAADVLRQHGRCLILDAHSFPSRPLRCDLDQSPGRPDICIGTDGFHTPSELTTAAVEVFEEAGFNVAVNRPFSGSMVPQSRYNTDRRVQSLMVEVNRCLYMDEAAGTRLESFGDFRRELQACVVKVIATAE